ncbi:MAG: hypothetical protein U9N12_00810 [Euryarchaeota archaeon]|nr:hypothetical protein [Euryarchaeota archaeon]
MIPASPEKNSILIHTGGKPILKAMETELKESTAGIIDELAEEFHIGRSALLARIIEGGLQAELVKRSVRLYAGGKVSMWKAAQLAGVSFYEMMTEVTSSPLQVTGLPASRGAQRRISTGLNSAQSVRTYGFANISPALSALRDRLCSTRGYLKALVRHSSPLQVTGSSAAYL